MLPRYGPAVLPLVFETGGRFGLASTDALATVATDAKLAADVTTARPLWCRWRTELESIVLYTTSDVALLRLGDAASTMASARRTRSAAHRALKQSAAHTVPEAAGVPVPSGFSGCSTGFPAR